MANVMLREGKYDEAERLYKQAREQFVLLNSPYEIASCDGNLAIVAGAQGKYDEAKRLLQQAREQFAKLNMPAAIAHCNLGIAEMMRQQGEYDEAKRLCQQAREQLAQLNMPSFVADCNFILAEIMRQIGEYDESKKLYQAGLDKSIDETRWELLFGLGKVNFEQGNPKEASTYYEESISVIESIRGRQQEDTAKTGVMHNKIDVYATMVRLCCEQEDFEKAFEYAERAKSRALLDLMEQATRGLKAKTHKGQAAKDTAIDARAKASKKSDDETPENGPNLLSIALKAEEELSEEDFELASFISVQARTLEEIRVSLPKDTALLEYFYEGDTAYVFSVMQDDLFVEEFDIGVVRPLAEVTENRREFENAEELLTGVEGNEEVTILRGMLHPDAPVIAQGELSIKDWLCYTTFALYESRNEPTGEIKQVKRGSNLRIKDEAYEHLAILYRELIRPMQDVVDAAERIVIVPHGVLHYVPFSALIDVPEGREREAKQLIQMGEAKYLIETKTISMMPSGSMIDVCQKKPRPQPENCLAVSQPALGKDERPIIYRCELEDYFSEEKTELLLEQAATIPNFVQAAHTHLHSVIHFDTHGMLNANNGLYSWLAMSKPTEYGAEIEPLYAKDIFNLDFRSCIVVLRACMSGLGKVHPGDDIIGLTRAFFYAGTPSIVASMWEVDDRESHDLIETFYDAWLECGDKAEALRQAQLEAMKFLDDLGEERHPYHWAGFALYGDWKDEKP
jgi:CHAT domain-containing protein/predicted negative regulator of RcsB-dependent stress response